MLIHAHHQSLALATTAQQPYATAATPSQTFATAPFAILFFLGFMALIAGLIVLKGVALWRAARNGHKGWFIAMLIVNLMGILEIIYLLTAGKNVPPAGPVMPGTAAPTPEPIPAPTPAPAPAPAPIPAPTPAPIPEPKPEEPKPVEPPPAQ